MRVLYTDYDYALIHECSAISPTNGRCIPDNAQTILYGRRKPGSSPIPEDTQSKIVEVANEACIYLEDFTAAVLPYGKLFLIAIRCALHTY